VLALGDTPRADVCYCFATRMERIRSSPSRLRSFTWVVLAYAAALAIALFVAGRAAGRPLWQTVALADFAGTVVVFVCSVVANNSSLYDPYWSVAPMVIAPAIALTAAPSMVPVVRQIVVVALVLVWGARLTWNWARGWQGLAHEDWRYVDLRRTTGKRYWLVSFLGLHLLPSIWVYLGCLSLLPALRTGTRSFGALDALAFAVGAGAVTLETVADMQLRAFRADAKPGEIMDRGVWAYSRHPNYLGEILLWWSLFLFALAADPHAWWCVVGPLSINALFVFISVPLLEKRSLARRPGYAEHMSRVPGLLPRPWRRVARDQGGAS
jgi:steroid 5-alpha reductase family enzyme